MSRLSDNLKIEIDYLPDNLEIITTLAHWHHAQWGYLNPSRKIEDVIEKLKFHLRPESVPTTFIAHSQNAFRLSLLEHVDIYLSSMIMIQ